MCAPDQGTPFPAPDLSRRRLLQVAGAAGASYLFSSALGAPAHAAEGDGEIRARGAVDHAAQEIDPRGPIDGHEWHRQIEQPLEQRGGLGPRRSPCSGAEQRVHVQPRSRPRPVGGHLANAIGASQRGNVCRERRGLSGKWRDPDRHPRAVQRPREHPSVAAVMP